MRYEVPRDAAGQRLDRYLCQCLAPMSRTRVQSLIRDGHVVVNGQTTEPSTRVRTGQEVEVSLPPPRPTALLPESIALDILYEDRDVVVLNKPAGLVVHPAAGHDTGTLVHALLHHCPDLQGVGGEMRPGIVHRLDRDTSGVLAVAKHDAALECLADQFRARTVEKQYAVIVRGVPAMRGTIRTLIGRNPRNRKRMSARVRTGRPAVTHFERAEVFADHARLIVKIETGRTHQIRVHLAHAGHPVVGDVEYGRAPARGVCPAKRQMLHAEYLTLNHPTTGRRMVFHAPWPDDFRACVESLRKQAREQSGRCA